MQLGLRSAILCLLFRDMWDITDIAAFCNAWAWIATSFLCINPSLGAEGIITILSDVPFPSARRYNHHLGPHLCFITFYKQTGRQTGRTSSPPNMEFSGNFILISSISTLSFQNPPPSKASARSTSRSRRRFFPKNLLQQANLAPSNTRIGTCCSL